MFARLAKSGLVFVLARFWPAQPQRIAPAPLSAGRPTHCNDNLPGLRRPEDRCRIPAPALACHWFNRGGRLECRWEAEAGGDAPRGGLGERHATSRASGLSQRSPTPTTRPLLAGLGGPDRGPLFVGRVMLPRALA